MNRSTNNLTPPVRYRTLLAALVITASLLAVSSLHWETASVAQWQPVELWAAELPGTVTGACFQVNSSGTPVCYVCANGQLLALDSNGRRISNFSGIEESVERLVPIPAAAGRVAFVGFESGGEQILFLDRDGNLIGKSPTPQGNFDWLPSDEKRYSSIDWLAVQDNDLLVGFSAFDGLQMFKIKPGQTGVELVQKWADMDVGNCRNVALGSFGGGFVAASSDAGGEIFFYSRDGAQRRSWKFDYFAPLGVLPSPDGTSTLVGINSFGDLEEAIGLRHDKVVFRKLIGAEGDKVSWRFQRIVSGRFVDAGSHQVAVLRGDGSVVLFDAAGQAVNLIAADANRIAVELGPPHNGRDTLLCAEEGKLRRIFFPAAMPQATAEAAAAVKHPNEALLRIAEDDTADDLWGRALCFALFGGASDAETLRLFTEALARTDDKAPLYVSLADHGTGGTQIRRVLSHVLAAVGSDFDIDAAGTAQDERPPDAGVGRSAAFRFGRSSRESFRKAARGTPARQKVGELMATLLSRDSHFDATGIAEDERALDNGVDQSTIKRLARMMVESFQKSAPQGPERQKIGELLATLQSPGEMPALLYLAAVAENPQYVTAWYRLTKFANEQLAGSAAAALIERDPDNAMAYYSQALHRLNFGDPAGALESIQLGNRKNICRTYPFPVPTEIGFRFPRSEYLEHFGVAGKPASAIGLAYNVEVSANVAVFGTSLIKELRNLSYELNEEGGRIFDAGRTERAIEYWEATRRMGFQIMKVLPRESLLVLTATRIASMPFDELKDAYEALGDQSALETLEETDAQRRRFARLYNQLSKKKEWTESDEGRVLLGERNLFEEEHNRATQALLAAGLIDAPGMTSGRQDEDKRSSQNHEEGP